MLEELHVNLSTGIIDTYKESYPLNVQKPFNFFRTMIVGIFISDRI